MYRSKNLTLNNKLQMPAIGLGTYPMKGLELINTVLKAIDIGYNSFDTAAAYKNHEDIGKALKLSNTSREEIFITSKLSNKEQRAGDVEQALKTTLNYLGLEYLDLYLMHWPNPGTFLKSWSQMEKLYKEGLVKAIGVCNFHEHHLRELLSNGNIIPSINQVELHPLLNQKPLVKYCKSKNIVIEAYSPLARMHKKLIKNPLLVKIAEKYQKTVPQIILRWNYQNDIISIPKTQNEERLNENINIFDFNIDKYDLDFIDSLNESFRVRYNPDSCDFNKL